MRTLGIVLAAGDATRMPNKALLPAFARDPDGHVRPRGLVIDYALDLCAATCDHTVVVENESRIIREVILRTRDVRNSVDFVVQQTRVGGAPHAAFVGTLAKPVIGEPYDAALITFCDNTYSPADALKVREVMNLRDGLPRASVRNVEYNGEQLDGYDHLQKKWVKRPLGEAKFAGWMYVPSWTWKFLPAWTDFLGFMNSCPVYPVQMPVNGWFDVGVPDSYMRYLQWVSRSC